MSIQKSIWTSLKLDVGELNIDKLKTVPADLSKLNSAVHNDVRTTEYNKVATKFNEIVSSRFFKKI